MDRAARFRAGRGYDVFGRWNYLPVMITTCYSANSDWPGGRTVRLKLDITGGISAVFAARVGCGGLAAGLLAVHALIGQQ